MLALFKKLFVTFRKLYKKEYKDPNESGGRFKTFVKVQSIITISILTHCYILKQKSHPELLNYWISVILIYTYFQIIKMILQINKSGYEFKAEVNKFSDQVSL